MTALYTIVLYYIAYHFSLSAKARLGVGQKIETKKGPVYCCQLVLSQINMPSGAYVKAEVHPLRGLNIYLHALAEDQQRSSGLCGNFDGERQNDLKIKGTEQLDPSNNQHNQNTVIPRQFSNSYR